MAKGRYKEDYPGIVGRTYRLLDNTLWQEARWSPPMDCYETKEALFIEVHLPGVRLEDLEVTLSGNMIKISGTRDMKPKDNVRFHRIERPSGSFERTVNLPFSPSEKQISATMKQGVLRITITKNQGVGI